MLQAEEAELFRQLEFMMRMMEGDLKVRGEGDWVLTVSIAPDIRQRFQGNTLQGIISRAWRVVRPGC